MVAWTTTSQPLIGSNSQEYVPKKGFHKWTPNKRCMQRQFGKRSSTGMVPSSTRALVVSSSCRSHTHVVNLSAPIVHLGVPQKGVQHMEFERCLPSLPGNRPFLLAARAELIAQVLAPGHPIGNR